MARIIDDFSTGAYDVTIKSGYNLNYQEGEGILGGYRYTGLQVAVNPQEQPAHLDINKDCLNLSIGASQYVRLEVGYGYQKDGSIALLHEKGIGDFKSMGDAFKLNFRFSDTMLINFNIVVFTATGWAQFGQNYSLPASSTSSIEAPFAQFGSPTQADFSRVGVVLFVFQTLADSVIDSIEII